MTIRFDHRQGRRLYLKRPAPAMITGGRARIVDIALESIGIEHEFEIERGSPIFIEFSWNGTAIDLSCTVARTRPLKEPATGYRSGLRVKRTNSPGLPEYVKRVKAGLQQLREREARLPPAI